MKSLGSRLSEKNGAVERRLLDAVKQELSQSQGKIAVVVHLSKLHIPDLKPHIRRMAFALMNGVAMRHGGDLYSLANGDLVLLYRPRPKEALSEVSVASEDDAMSAALERLLMVTRLASVELVSTWPLDTSLAPLSEYAEARVQGGEVVRLVEGDVSGQVAALDVVSQYLGSPTITDCIHSRTAALFALDPTSHNLKMETLFREVAFSPSALQAKVPAMVGVISDPFLFSYLSMRMDQRMMEVLQSQVGRSGSLGLVPQAGGSGADSFVLHVNLTIKGALSAEFTRLHSVCQRARVKLGVEISLLEAVADPQGFMSVQQRMTQIGCDFVLDEVSYLAMTLARPWSLKPPMLKLDWTPRILEMPSGDHATLVAAVHATGASSIVLEHVDTEAALRWGMEHGIRRFQGQYIDMMASALKMSGSGKLQANAASPSAKPASPSGPAGRPGVTLQKSTEQRA